MRRIRSGESSNSPHSLFTFRVEIQALHTESSTATENCASWYLLWSGRPKGASNLYLGASTTLLSVTPTAMSYINRHQRYTVTFVWLSILNVSFSWSRPFFLGTGVPTKFATTTFVLHIFSIFSFPSRKPLKAHWRFISISTQIQDDYWVLCLRSSHNLLVNAVIEKNGKYQAVFCAEMPCDQLSKNIEKLIPCQAKGEIGCRRWEVHRSAVYAPVKLFTKSAI